MPITVQMSEHHWDNELPRIVAVRRGKVNGISECPDAEERLRMICAAAPKMGSSYDDKHPNLCLTKLVVNTPKGDEAEIELEYVEFLQ